MTLKFLQTLLFSKKATTNRKFGIDKRLSLYISMVSLIPLIIISVSLFIITKHALENGAEERLINLARDCGKKISYYVDSRHYDIKILANTPIFKGADNAAKQKYIQKIISNYPYYSAIVLVDTDGKIIACTRKELIGASRANTDWFQQTINDKSGKIVFNDVYKSESAGWTTAIGFNVPIMDKSGKNVIGVISTRVSIKYIIDRVQMLDKRLAEKSYVHLINREGLIFVDQHGSILASPNKKELLKSYVNFSEFKKQSLFKSKEFIKNANNGSHEHVISTHYKLKGYDSFDGWGWSLIVSEPEKEVFAVAHNIRNIAIVLVIASAVITLLISTFFARRFSNTISKVADAAQIISQGNLKHKINYDAKDDVRDLVFSFNAMVENLDQTMASRDALTKEVEARRLAERELTITNKRLENSVKNADKMARNAEVANKTKSEFLANMSHEIRTPMNAVLGFSDILLDTDLDDEQLEHVTTIKQSGDTLLTLINDILDFSKIEEGELEFEEIDFNPELIVYDVCKLVASGEKLKPVEILCNIGENLPALLKGDPGRFRQVLINLLKNSYKFTQSGEIEIFIGIEEEKDNMLKIHTSIRDTGIGIPQDKLESIFMPFKQVDGSTTRKYGGTGLGLPICKKLANLFNGNVWAESVLSKGSVFHFTAWLGKTDKKKDSSQYRPVCLSGKKILIVDDNKTNLNILTHFLVSAGINVVAFEKSKDVLSALNNALKIGDLFDCCIVDIQMPEMDGYETAKQIRENNRRQISKIPLLALSSEQSMKKCKKVGFDAFLIKPVQREKLYKTLESILGTKISKTKELVVQNLENKAKRNAVILLTEDNLVNQKLAKLMLSKRGYTVEVANNGAQAVEKYTQSYDKFDLIFMDIQMPTMDGMKATKAIRKWEKETSTRTTTKQIPIIAMTANAMKGDREKYLVVGMDDYITKPIKKELMFEVLEKWIK